MSSRTYYLTAAIKLARGGVDLRRFHMHLDVDPRCLPPSENAAFVATCIHLLGFQPSEVADLGSEPPVMIAVFDSETACMEAYAEVVRRTKANPSMSQSDIDAMNAAALKRARKAKGRAAS